MGIYNEDLTFKDYNDQSIYEEMTLRVLPIIESYLQSNFSETEADLWITQRMLEGDIGLVVSDIFMNMQYSKD